MGRAATRMRALACAVSAVAVALAGCAGASDGGGDAASSSDEETTLRVSAAASLNHSFDELARTFEAAHTGVKVSMNYGGSSGLVQQLTEGAPADVFASADQKNMKKLT
ncbi:UNVERIFIED_CONTAM: extracellular solute-binding protein, partial [Acinetobacter sp. HSTU-ASm16]